ncbi:T9SS type A sorting domain-containing protein [bacterium]|nr:T9SS type A sorting domain-containing protein [bacterium]
MNSPAYTPKKIDYGIIVLLYVMLLIPFAVRAQAEMVTIDYDVRGIAEDHDGILWLGTEDGILMYDGVRWKRFTNKETGRPGGVSANVFRAAAVDQDNVKWFGYKAPVTSFDGITWKHYEGDDICPQEYFITRIAVDLNNEKWFTTYGGGVWSFDGTRWEHYTTGNSGLLSGEFTDDQGNVYPQGDTIYSIAVDKDNVKWFGSDIGLSRFDGENWTTYDQFGLIQGLFADKDNKLWIGTSDAVYRFDGQNAEKMADNRNVFSFDQDRDGAVWLIPGPYSYDGETWTLHRVDRTNITIRPKYTWRVFIDHANTRWIGTDNGILSFDGETWREYQVEIDLSKFPLSPDTAGQYTPHRITKNDFPFDVISSIAEDRKGNVWVTINEGGAASYKGETWTVYNPSNSGIATDSPHAVAVDLNDTVWFGTSAGVSRFDGAAWKTFTVSDGLVNADVRAAAVDHDNVVWFGTMGGVSCFDGTSWKSYGTDDGLADSEIVSVAVDRDNVKWFGGNTKGVTSFDGYSMRIYTTADGLGDNHVPSIAVDQNNVKVFATGTVTFFDGSTWSEFTADDGLWENDIINVFVDSDNRRWLGSRMNDAYCIDDSKLYQYNYTFMYGHDVNVVYIDSTGRMWFATSWGLTSFTPRGAVSLADETGTIPQPLPVISSFPNPFNPSTTIGFTLPEAGLTNLSVYNIAGQKVRGLVSENMTAGHHTAVWDGKDENGVPVSAGIYFARLTCGGRTVSGKMVMVK